MPLFSKRRQCLPSSTRICSSFGVGNGTEDYRDKMINMSKEFGLAEQMIWSKARPDMPAVYNAMDMIVSASSYGEGFSNVIGEAMGVWKCPCVVTDVGDSAFIVGNGGEVVPPSNAEALKEAIARLADKIGAGHCDRFGNRQAYCPSIFSHRDAINN